MIRVTVQAIAGPSLGHPPMIIEGRAVLMGTLAVEENGGNAQGVGTEDEIVSCLARAIASVRDRFGERALARAVVEAAEVIRIPIVENVFTRPGR